MKVKPAPRAGKVVIEINPGDDAVLGRAARITEAPVPLPFRIKKILVPVDFSDCSLKALTYATAFARQLGATIDVLHVVAPYYALDPYGISEFQRVEKEMRAAGEQKLAALVLNALPQEVPAETFVRTGKPSVEIIAAAKELEADLIIISTHGHTGLKHVLLGSTTENVVRNAPCPVLTVREQEREFIPN